MPRETFRALLIANSTFPVDPASFQELRGPKYDLPLIWQALIHPRLGLFRRENVQLLPERNNSQITAAMETFFREAGPDDRLLLYYSGHGDRDLRGNFYLCASNTKRDQLLATGISDRLIAGLMDESSARSLVVIFDCCFSGAAFKGSVAVPNLDGAGRYVLQSSGAEEASKDAATETEASAFTHYLVEALLSGELDGDGDGYVGFDDVYHFVSDKLMASGQTAHRRADGAGSVALARALPRTQLSSDGPTLPEVSRPVLKLSRPDIDIRDVPAEHILPPEEVEVFNAGGGKLEWTARSMASWIAVESHATGFSMRLTPKPGVNHGLVRVDDRRGGGTEMVRVVVHVLAPAEEPHLSISETEVDFGVLSQGQSSPHHTLHLQGKLGGQLDIRITASEPWMEARLFGSAIIVSISTAHVGSFSGEILVASAAGDARVRIRLQVEAGPLLSVEPPVIDFGKVKSPEGLRRTVRIRNVGHGQLTWQQGGARDFFAVERTGDDLSVRLLDRPGCHIGSIWVSSNGGEANVDVRADIEAREVHQPEGKRAGGSGLEPGPTRTALPIGPKVRVHLKDRDLVFDPGQTVSIGRQADCDVVSDNHWVSRLHAVLRCESGRWILADMGSKEGVFAKGRRVTSIEVEAVTTVWLGGIGEGQRVVVATVPTPPKRTAAEPDRPAPGHLLVRGQDQELDLSPDRTITIGRDKACDLTIDNPFVSSRHVEIRYEHDGWWLTDVGSSRGTFHDSFRVERLDIDSVTTVRLGPTDRGSDIVLIPGNTDPVRQGVFLPPAVRPSRRSRNVRLAVIVITIVILLLLV